MTNAKKLTQLLDLHQDLGDIFVQHQRALLRMDSITAMQRLEEFEVSLLNHIADEDDFLLPLYRERAEIAIGGAPEIFLNEHAKMRTYVELFKAEIPKLIDSKDRERDTLFLLDSQNTFKRLMVHHDVREQKFLYPELDRVTSPQERDELFARLRLRPVRVMQTTYLNEVVIDRTESLLS
jgi:hemerythrin-like domain-containing protein